MASRPAGIRYNSRPVSPPQAQAEPAPEKESKELNQSRSLRGKVRALSSLYLKHSTKTLVTLWLLVLPTLALPWSTLTRAPIYGYEIFHGGFYQNFFLIWLLLLTWLMHWFTLRLKSRWGICTALLALIGQWLITSWVFIYTLFSLFEPPRVHLGGKAALCLMFCLLVQSVAFTTARVLRDLLTHKA